MARTLPWLVKSPAKNDIKSSSPAPKRRKREPSPEDLVDADLNDVATPPPRSRQKQRADRDPSTSPAGPAASAPDVEYMRPGANADDVWLMVEDEFHSTAKIFSGHLHAAEYVRLKKLSKSRGEKTLSALDHGTDGRTGKSRALLQREEKDEIEKEKQDALDADDEDDGGDAYLQDPQLAGLMTTDTDRRVGRALAGMVKAKSNTRAAAGFLESPHKAKRHRDALGDDAVDARRQAQASSSRVAKVFEAVSQEDDGDNLDAKPAMSSRKPELKQDAKISNNDRSRRRDASEACGSNVFKRFAEPSKHRSSESSEALQNSSTPKVKIENDEDPYEAPRLKPARPTYRKAQNRQASRALNTEDANKPTRPPLLSKSSENGLFERPSVSSSTPMEGRYREAKPVQSNSRTKRTLSLSSTTAPDSEEAGRNEVKAAAASYLAKRSADRARREKEQQSRGKRTDDIPTFLF